MPLCLIVEDDRAQQRVLRTLLAHGGYETAVAGTAQEMLQAISELRPEMILMDLGLPDANGLKLIPKVRSINPLSRIVVLTGTNDVAAAVEALRAGARHYLVKPWDDDELLHVLEREAHNVDHAESDQRARSSKIVWGQHPAMTRIQVQLDHLSRAPWTPVLINGETGTGKELVARELHQLTQAGGPIVALNCAAIPGDLLESELFGHEKGAFTGADSRRRGLAEVARNGTLFLDEVGEMSPGLQAKLLRFLQDYTFRRVGGHEETTSRCRIVAATNRDLGALQADGSFRSDLFYRLAVVRIEIPALWERRGDIVPLANALLTSVSESLGMPPRPFHPEAELALREHRWRGNVRELRNRIERAMVLSHDQWIFPEDLDLPDREPGEPSTVADDAEHLRRVLRECGWNVSRAARELGVARHWLRYRMSKFEIRPPGGGNDGPTATH